MTDSYACKRQLDSLRDLLEKHQKGKKQFPVDSTRIDEKDNNRPGNKNDKSVQEFEKRLKKLQQRLERSVSTRQAREAKSFKLEYPQALPVSQEKDHILGLIEQHQVLIVAGETGSGKTTQLPKICLEAGFGRKASIGHTQPRRLAASNVAHRIAEELGEEVGETVAYQVRFDARVTDTSMVKLMTDGILLNEIARDPWLNSYDVIIIDEAHERSLNIDFLLGYLKNLLQKRKNLKLLVTSATIDVNRFSEFFDNAPIVEVSGKTWPVETVYFPEENWKDNDLCQGIVDAVEHILQAEAAGETPGQGGDMLVFLPGEKQIRDAHKLLKQVFPGRLDILPLYARLNFSEQQKVFRQQNGKRRVVLATNVAETSLTVPGIHYVIDSGLARISRYSFRNKLQQLPVEQISKASANQRAGRCGRIAPGFAVRLYAEEDYQRSSDYTDPEIQRTNLAAVILQMAWLKLGDIRRFPFLQPPDKRQVSDGYRLLEELSAFDNNRRITALGRKLARLPADPRIARMLLEAGRLGALSEVLVVASALSIQDPRETPAEKKEAARQAHSVFVDKRSDFTTMVNLWQAVEQQRQQLGSAAFKKYCQKHFLSWVRLRDWRETHRQLLLVCKSLGLKPSGKAANYEAVHKAILSGLVSQVGVRDEKAYRSTRNREFVVFPGSALNKTRAKWLMAAEMLETKRIYAMLVAEIDPHWLQNYAVHLFKASYSEPSYNPGRGQVLARQTLLLFGLPVVVGKAVNYSDTDPVLAREIFIRQALVEGAYKYKKQRFYQHNQSLLQELQEYETRQRRPDLLVEDDQLFDFYDKRIPRSVCNLAGFESWRKKAESKQPDILLMSNEDVMSRSFSDQDKARFPSVLQVAGVELPLQYSFEPGRENDGVTVTVPVSILNRLPEYAFDRLVPGLLEEKVIEMLRLLPKSIRKYLVPLPDYVKSIYPSLYETEMPLHELIKEQIERKYVASFDDQLWKLDKLDDFYQIRVCLVDSEGGHLACSRDFAKLKQQYRDEAQKTLREGDREQEGKIQQKGLTSWDFPDFTPSWEYVQGEVNLVAYPALVDHGASVAIELFDSISLARQKHWLGLSRLVLLENKKQWRFLKSQFKKTNTLQLQSSYFPDFDEVVDDALLLAVANACFVDAGIYRQQDFRDAVSLGKSRIAAEVQKLVETQKSIYAFRWEIARLLESSPLQRNPDVVADVKKQLGKLLPPHFFISLPSELVPELPRYLEAVCYRLQNLQGHLNKDRDAMRQIAALQERLDQRLSQQPLALQEDRALQEYCWMIEELRVSLFAQALGTRKPVSRKRLERLWSETIA